MDIGLLIKKLIYVTDYIDECHINLYDAVNYFKECEMKKILVIIAMCSVIAGFVFAGDNQSAKYMRVLSREAATDSIDTAYFNPAGTAFLEKGFHGQINGQTVYLNYEHTAPDFSAGLGGPKNFEAKMKHWVPFIPSAHAGYNGGNWTVFLSYAIPEGGGSLDYSDGVAIGIPTPAGFIQGKLKVASATHSISLGGSYAINDTLSIGGKATMSIATTDIDANITKSTASAVGAPNDALNGKAELKASGIGYGGAIGIHYFPLEELGLSLTVESTQKIEMDIEDSKSANATLLTTVKAMVVDADTPWRIRFGASYAFPFGLEIPVTFKYNLWNAVDEDTNKDSWLTAIGFRYPLSEKLEVSLGGSYSTGKVKEDKLDNSFLNPELDAITIGTGVGWEIIDNLNLDFGVLYPYYMSADGEKYNDMMKQVIDMAIGIGYVY